MNDFEITANEVDKRNQTYESSQECAIEWIKNCRTATVTFPSNTKYASKIKKLAVEHPDEVKIRIENTCDGSLVATIPTKYIKISHPRKVEYTDEQRAALAERLRNSIKR